MEKAVLGVGLFLAVALLVAGLLLVFNSGFRRAVLEGAQGTATQTPQHFGVPTPFAPTPSVHATLPASP